MSEVESPLLKESGLNMQAVFNLESLPDELLTILKQDIDLSPFKQLIVFAHGGKAMWKALQQSPFKNKKDPIDNFSIDVVQRFFKSELAGFQFHLLYPGSQQTIPLRKLGSLAGWHHPSPFRIGINEQFGSWFAYRVVILADTDLTPTEKLASANPCDECIEKPCIPICPVNALEQGDLSLKTCLSYRLEDHSRCKQQCLSRLICPIAKGHKYTREQMSYHYGISMQTIKDLAK